MRIAIFGGKSASYHFAENLTMSWVQLLSTQHSLINFTDAYDDFTNMLLKLKENHARYDVSIFIEPVNINLSRHSITLIDPDAVIISEQLFDTIIERENLHWDLADKELSLLTDTRHCGISESANASFAVAISKLISKEIDSISVDMISLPQDTYTKYFVPSTDLAKIVDNNFKESTQNHTLCNYPFNEIAMKDYDGKRLTAFWPCCMMGNFTKDRNTNNALRVTSPDKFNPQEMYDHPRMQTLRSNILNGVKDDACSTCWGQEDRGLRSFRTHSNGAEKIKETGLRTIDLTASNICNLRCRMCSPTASNLLMADYKFFDENNLLDRVKVTTSERFVKSIPVVATDSIQWEWLMENTNSITEIKASGGEPFYDNKVLILLKKYVETGAAKNTKLHFHTNATQFTEEICHLLNEFKLNSHTFSVDGTDKIYEYIRYPATFEELNKSIDLYSNSVKNYYKMVEFNLVVSSLNLLNIDKYLDWVYTKFDTPWVHLSEMYPFDRGTSISRLPKHLLELAKSRLVSYQRDEMELCVGNLLTSIDNAIAMGQENRELMLEEITLFDRSRSQSYKDFLDPDLVEWLDK
jgi:MoaA/NifB/PqqE/SkfB family radical SAM enzyme